MTKASDNVFPKVILAEGAAPSTPSSGQVKLYAKTDGLLYSKDDAGAESALASNTMRGWAIFHNSNQAFSTSGEADTLFDTDTVDTSAYHFTSSANLTGTVSKTASSGAVTGSSTSFTTELTVGQVITIPGTAVEYFRVVTITDNTNIVVSPNAQNNASGQTATRKNAAIVIPTGLGGYYDLGFQAQISAATLAYIIVRKFTSSTATNTLFIASINSSVTGSSHRWWTADAKNISLTAGDILIVKNIANAAANLESANGSPTFTGRLVGV